MSTRPPYKRGHASVDRVSLDRALAGAIDLTGDDDDGARHVKQRRLGADHSSASMYLTPPPSSTPSPSPSYASQPSSKQFSSSPALSVSSTPPSSGELGAGAPAPVPVPRKKADAFGMLKSKAVGCRYYNGVANPGDPLWCRREPTNQYDRNAICVDSKKGVQIGHLPREIAARLAPLIDAKVTRVMAELLGRIGPYECPIRLYLFCSEDPNVRAKVSRVISDFGGKLNRQSGPSFSQPLSPNKNGGNRRPNTLMPASALGLAAPKPAVSMESLVQKSQVLQTREFENFDFAQGMSEDELAKLPFAAQPKELVSKLLPYQLQGLAWLTAKESPKLPAPGSSGSVQLWKIDADGRYINMATGFSTSKAPKLLSGGILADDMGLGKTLQTISLILTGGGSGPTLIVAPLSVMSNWAQQVERHVREQYRPRVLIYHGPSRSKFSKTLGEYGIIVTSYDTMRNDKPLSSVSWRRIVLDEGHCVRNPASKTLEAACKLTAESRWVVSGTPIINNIKDLYSLLKFLRFRGGLEDKKAFDQIITNPLKYFSPTAKKIVQALVGDLCIRRNKTMGFVDLKLPAKTEYMHVIKFTTDEQAKYDALFKDAQRALEELGQARKAGNSTGGRGRASFHNVLASLTRLRQMCCHWHLCRKQVLDLLARSEGDNKDMSHALVQEPTGDHKTLLQKTLREQVEAQEDCQSCQLPLNDPVITHCGHSFCRECITEEIGDSKRCPVCQAAVSQKQLLEPTPETEDDGDASGLAAYDPARDDASSKTQALLQIVAATLKRPGSKMVIFSQWTSFLSIIQRQLSRAGYADSAVVRIDGAMKARDRDAAIKALDDARGEARIMLASLRVAGVGLTLVSADTVVLADSWWAPTIEDQAVDRVHRIGQTRATTVWRLVVDKSIEKHVLTIQRQKRELVSMAFREDEEEEGGGGEGGQKAAAGKSKTRKKVVETRLADIAKLLAM